MTVIPESSAGPKLDAVAENVRRSTIAAIRLADTGPADVDFERLARVAAQGFAAPCGAVALLDGDGVWFYARHGFSLERAPALNSPWASAVTIHDLAHLVVPDLSSDSRFASVRGTHHGRFFAAAPVVVHGQKIGALGVMAPEPRDAAPDGALLTSLVDLAQLAGTMFELKDEARVRARMAAELIKEEWRHALTLEAGKVGSWVWDLRTGDIVSNDIFRRMFGLDLMKPIQVGDLMATIEPADIAGVNAGLAATFEQGIDYAVEFRVAKTGRWLIGRGRVYQRDGAGKPLIMMGVNIDVTDAREAAEQTRQLLRELNHRVKNTLAMIQSLARQTLRQKPDPQQFIDAFSGRLRTLSDAHALLSDGDWAGVGLVQLLRSQVDPYLLDSPDQLVLVGEDCRLPPDQALGLGLIVHELASNAVKFGALSRRDGRVKVSWSTSAGPARVELTWQESGGPAVAKPAAAGFGTRLIERSLDKVLNSSVELSFPVEGAEAKISLPLE